MSKLISDINQLLIENKCFVAFKNPQQQNVFLFNNLQFSLKAVSILDIQSNWNGFLFMPFDTNQNGFFFDFQDTKSNSFIPFKTSKVTSQIDASSYLKAIIDLKKLMITEDVDKLVFSRNIQINALSHNQLSTLFNALCLKYANAFVYIVHLPNQDTWIGATPETLIQINSGVAKTMALAGTQLAQNVSPDLITWETKEIDEQQFVTDYILEKLLSENAANIIIGKPYTKLAANLAHICTEISFVPPKNIGSLLQALHPTPAVCGVPKLKAFELIAKLENYDREFYTGFLGQISPNQISLFVNLRCLKSDSRNTYIYTGGGITRKSIPELEWNETERKADTLLSVINQL